MAVEFKYGVRIQTNNEYSKRYRTQRPFRGSIISSSPNGRGQVHVLKDRGNDIWIETEYLSISPV